MGAESAVDVLFRKSDNEEKSSHLAEYQKQFLNPNIAVHMGYVDEIIEPAQTRIKLVRVLQGLCGNWAIQEKKPHRNIPL